MPLKRAPSSPPTQPITMKISRSAAPHSPHSSSFLSWHWARTTMEGGKKGKQRPKEGEGRSDGRKEGMREGKKEASERKAGRTGRRKEGGRKRGKE